MSKFDPYSEFFEAVAHMKSSGRATPAFRALGYIFSTHEERTNGTLQFASGMRGLMRHVRATAPGVVDPEYLNSMPRAWVLVHAKMPAMVVVVNTEDGRAMALRHLGRPAYQTTVAPGV